MQLIGVFDSPYVRRTAIAMRMLGIPVEHRPLSVFRNFDEFHAINPAVKAPTLVCDDGTVMMDSSLILDYAERIAPGPRSMLPSDLDDYRRTLRVTGLALAACEKGISIYYERELRPADKWHEPWITRVRGQLDAACRDLEAEVAERPLAGGAASMMLDGVTTAVTWSFLQLVVADAVPADHYPRWRAFAEEAEGLDDFLAFPQR